MDTHTRRLAAAAYDRALEERRRTEERVVLVGVDLGADGHRTLIGDVALGGDPPEVLRLAVRDTLAMLRIAWIALLGHDDRDGGRRQLEATHAALQCELAATEWTWATAPTEGHALGRQLARRRERLRETMALPRPYGTGLLLPRDARASEALPTPIVDSYRRLETMAIASGGRASLAREVAHVAIGAWRLRELEATAAALAIDATLDHSTPELSPASEERPELRAAS
jgi:hypothetical protein